MIPWIIYADLSKNNKKYFPARDICFNSSYILHRLLHEDPRFIRKRAEKDKATEKDWALFKQDPNRFTQVLKSCHYTSDYPGVCRYADIAV